NLHHKRRRHASIGSRLLRISACTLARRWRGRVAGAPGDHDRSVPGRRPRGYRRACRRQRAERNVRQAVRHRQSRGRGGNIGGAAVAKALADGYTLLFATPAPAALNKLMYKSLPYDPERDFTAVALVAKSPLIITAK